MTLSEILRRVNAFKCKPFTVGQYNRHCKIIGIQCTLTFLTVNREPKVYLTWERMLDYEEIPTGVKKSSNQLTLWLIPSEDRSKWVFQQDILKLDELYQEFKQFGISGRPPTQRRVDPWNATQLRNNRRLPKLPLEES